MIRFVRRSLAVVLVLSAVACADSWPTYRHDIRRSGITSETVSPALKECWTLRSPHAPRPAWEPPRAVPVEGYLELPRIRFDDAFHVAVTGTAVYFGSSADHKVYCVDAATGRVKWSVFTDGPIRLAPTAWKDRIYVGSDDGVAYCLSAADGRVIWRHRVGPRNDRLLGHGSMISRWPLRTGVLVDKGVAYMGAGIFPAEGVYIEALDAKTGETLWRNDAGTETTDSRISPQGYLLAGATQLYAPMGRVSPAAYDRATGRLVRTSYFGKNIGGTNALLAGEHLYTGTEEILGYHGRTQGRFSWFEGRQLLVTKDVSYVTGETEMMAVSRTDYPKASVRRFALRDQRMRLGREVRAPRRAHKKLSGQADRERKQLAGIEAQIAGLAGGNKEQLAALQAKRLAAAKALQATLDKLESAAKDLAALEQRLEAMEEEWSTVGKTMASGILWRLACECPDSLILAGSILFAGGQDSVVAVDRETGKQLWSAKVDGKARGLAVAAGRLFVSTDSGAIHCFGADSMAASGDVVLPANASPYPKDRLTPVYEAAAERIVRQSGIRKGYCLVMGSEKGRLAYELAKRTELDIYGVDPDPDKVTAAREALDAAGLYGVRVTVTQGDLAALPYTDYFADLIVSDRALVSGKLDVPAQELQRMLKPRGGVALVGQPRQADGKVPVLTAEALRRWLPAARVDGREGPWAMLRRGPVPGAGKWTALYGNPGNTACGDDTAVKCPLGVLWFGDPGPLQMISRHRRAAGPLSANGRLYVQGENAVMAYDAYNGRKLWEHPVPKVVRATVSHDCSNLAADDRDFYVVAGTKCLRLDGATGKLRATYSLPKGLDDGQHVWGYVAVSDGVLVGSRMRRQRTGNALFGYSLRTGRLRWVREAGTIDHPAISIGDGRVFFADARVTDAQRREAIRTSSRPMDSREREAAARTAKVRLVTALSLSTGRVVWQKPYDLTGCVHGAYWSALGSMYSSGHLVLFGIYSDGHYWKQFFAGQFNTRRVVTVSGRRGTPIWSKYIGYRVRPLIIGDTLHAEPWAFDLHTGEQRMRTNPITGQQEPWQFARPGHHCGAPAASPNCLFFRSYNIGYYDLLRDSGTVQFGAQRTGCWINFIPANGLLLIPEASSGCMCPFPIMSTVVLAPRARDRAWTKYSLSGPITPVKRMGVNLGAPGDRKDPSGRLWLSYPRPRGSLVLQFKAGVKYAREGGGGYFKQDAAYVPVQNTDSAWLYSSGVRALQHFELPLLDKEDGTARFTVRLHFAELEDIAPGRRVFDIRIQGKTVQQGFDVAKEAGGPLKAVVKEFKGIDVPEKLLIDLVPKAKQPTPDQQPVLQAVEVLREQMLTLGFTVPSYLLGDAEPEQSGDVRIANHKELGFKGTLQVTAPDGFSVTPAKAAVTVASGTKVHVALKAAVVKKGKRGEYPVLIRLLRKDGGVECERKAVIEYLADRGRVCLKAVADAHVGPSFTNKGGDARMLVDGGNARMGDHSHHVSYLRFRIDVPGKPLSAVLRIYNASNPTSQGGRICVVTEPWQERRITYSTRPMPGQQVGNIGPVASKQAMTVPLKLSLEGMKTLSLVIDPTNCDGTDYLTREGGKPAELIVEYAP